jgi:hypothetical protein
MLVFIPKIILENKPEARTLENVLELYNVALELISTDTTLKFIIIVLIVNNISSFV